MFLEEGAAEGVRGDVAFAQSLHETGYFRYGGIVQPSQNNYAGIGALNGNGKGQAATFPDPRTGVRAQIQHLKAYASREPLAGACVDPRFSLVSRGCAPCVEWLGAADNPDGRGWAVPGKDYGRKITAMLDRILAWQVPESPADGPDGTGKPDAGEGPDWQAEGLKALADAGVVVNPGYWEAKFGEEMTVGEVMGMLGRLLKEAG